MAFVRLLARAQNLKRYKNELIKEKQASIDYRASGKRKFKFKWIGVKIRAKFKRLKQRIGYCCCCRRFCFNLKHDGSLENYILKSFLGFIAGLVLTYIFFMIFVFQFHLKISTATIVFSIFGCILVNGLAFSTKIRCIVLLTLPHFFGERGRQVLIAYTLVLVISGPAKNILNNLGILSESLACGQEQLKSALRQIIDAIKKPFYAIKDAIKKVIATVKKIIKKIKEILIKIKRIIMAIIRVIKAVFMFLAKIINICNKELGTPFERCTRVFDNAIADCNAKLGPLFSWMCSITYIIKTVCYIVKIFDFVCMIVDFFRNSIIGVVIRKVKGFIRHIRTMFYVRIKFSHSFKFETQASKSIAEISKEIVDEVKERIRTIAVVFQFIFSAASLFIIIMIVKVIIYRYRFLTNDGFDNKYITEDFFQIDLQRAKHNRETVLPLNHREEKSYVKIKSSKLTDVENRKLRKAIMNLLTVNLKAGIYMAVDYALFWILNTIRFYGKFQSKIQAPNIPVPYISGKGLLADLLTSIVNAFQPMGLTLEIDTVPCLPTPIPPDYDRYIEIVTLLTLCWILTLLEPYGLRFRTYIMNYYHPTRGKQRAIWLYNKILRQRSSFLKFARRQLRRKLMGNKGTEKVTLKEFLSAHYRLFALCFDKKHTACLLCGKIFRENDSEKPIRCASPGCSGIYCDQCFADLRNLCTVCLSPIEYGDLSDLSEEVDSSEDEKLDTQKTKQRNRKWKRLLPRKKSPEALSNEEIPLIEISKASKSSIIDDDYRGKKYLRECNSVEETVKLLQEEVIDEEIAKVENNDEECLEKQNRSKKEFSTIYDEDSGNASTTASVSSDYSYSYQYSKEQQRCEPMEILSKDIEKQEILDYASMDSFRDDNSDDFDNEEADEEFVNSVYSDANDLRQSETEVSKRREMIDNQHLRRDLIKKDEINQVPSKKLLSKQTSTQIILCPESSKEKVENIKVDVGTVLSGETIKKNKQNQHIDFVGVPDTTKERHKRKLKKRTKRKNKVVICTCSDSNDEGIQYWEKTSFIGIPQSNEDRQSFAKCKCKKTLCICKQFSTEQENTSESGSYSSSSELHSLLQKKDLDHKKIQELKVKQKSSLKENREENVQQLRDSKLKMFIKRIIPKYKVQHEK